MGKEILVFECVISLGAFNSFQKSLILCRELILGSESLKLQKKFYFLPRQL